MKPPTPRTPLPETPVEPAVGAAGAGPSAATSDETAPARRATDRRPAAPAGTPPRPATTARPDPVLLGIARALRARVTAILGTAQAALGGGERQPVGAMRQIERSAQLLLSLVDDMVDLSMVQAGALQTDATEFRLAEAIDDVASVVGLQAEEAGIGLRFVVSPAVPTRLVGDPMRLVQVLNHLGAHAVRRLTAGDVTVAVDVLAPAQPADAADAGLLRFEVRADGPAAADPSALEGDVALAICERLVDAMGGSLAVVDAPDGGFAWRMAWRFGAAEGADHPGGEAAAGAGRLEGRRLLIVDGDAEAQRHSVEVARALGADVVAVDDGWDAMREVALAHQAGRPYDAALIDESLPGMEGLMCARQLVEHAPGPAPVLLLSTAGDPAALRALLEADRLAVREVLCKPLQPDRLAAALGPRPSEAQRAASGRAPTVRAAAGAAGALAGVRLLLVDDSAISQELAIEVLTHAGARVAIAVDGQQALEALAAVAFDAVVMDLEMPVMDGYEAVRSIRRQPRWRELPIVAMTASVGPAERARALAAGMNEHVGKPIDAQALVGALSRLLRRAPRAALPATAAWEPGAADDDPLATLRGIDAAIGRGNTMHNDALYRRLLLKFRDAHGQTPDRIAAAWLQGDRGGARRLVHDLAGVAGTLGAMGVHAAARLIEAVCAGEAGPEAFPALLEALRDELQPVMSGLESLGTA